jgi:WD40 repeat protein
MRFPAFCLFFFFPGATTMLNAQVEQQQYGAPVYWQQNTTPQNRLPGPPPCYEVYWEQGMEARRSGNHKTALEAFNKAADCPDFPDDQQLRDDLKVLIAQALRALERTRMPTTNGEVPRRSHVYSRAYLRNIDPNCFQMTRAEADRAFADSCWDDAVNLYRAAKSCDDANQTLRSDMDERIQACREAAEDELRASEQKAVRRERHAIASNLAAQARNLLKASDRSMAYRLADFANEYVAPALENNAECLQAMYDAWYFSPEQHAELLGAKALQAPFCYQLKENLEQYSFIHFTSEAASAQLLVFAPLEHRLYRWNAETFTPIPSVPIPDNYLRMEAPSNEGVLLFAADREYLLWQSPSVQHQFTVPDTKAHCFSNEGNRFYYWDTEARNVVELDLLFMSGARKGGARKVQDRVALNCIDDGDVLSLNMHKNLLWVGFKDRYELWDLNTQTRLRRITLLLPQHLQTQKRYLLPDMPGIVVQTDTAAMYCTIPVGVDTIWGKVMLAGTPMAFTDGLGLSAHFIELDESTGSSSLREAFGHASSRSDKLLVRNLRDGQPQYSAHLQPGDIFTLHSGAFSSDGYFFAAINDEGMLKLWALKDAAAQMAFPIGRNNGGALNANTQNLGLLQNRQLNITPLDQPQNPQYVPLPEAGNLTLLSMNSNWALYATEQDTVVAFDYVHNIRRVQYAPFIQTESAAAIDASTQKLIYASARSELVVRDLVTGKIQHQLPGHFTAVAPIPGGQYLVVQQLAAEFNQTQQTLARVWNPNSRDEKLPVVRLHSFFIEQICVSPSGRLAAFTDGSEIRLFALDNLLDEKVRLNNYNYRLVRKMLFTPDETALAVEYNDGSIVFWDLSTGQWRFHLVKPAGAQFFNSFDLGIAPDAHCLYQLSDDYVYKRWLHPDSIRAALISSQRPMIAFQPVQIRDLNLERALLYPGNFERLANSNDLPLIRSFFDFYREQALNSNNIGAVREYCARAFALYERLDPGGQRALRTTMIDMYRDFHWKLLLRRQTDEAVKVTQLVNKQFDKPDEVVLADAHTALLKNNLPQAAQGYAQWIGERYAAAPEDYLFAKSMKRLEQDFVQLAEYDLLEPEQLACACAALSDFSSPPSLCVGVQASLTKWLPPAEANTYSLLRELYHAKTFSRPAERARFLENAQQFLFTRSSSINNRLYEQVARQLSDVYILMGEFEQNMPPSEAYFIRAIELLEKPAPDAYAEKQRLERLILARNRLIERKLLTGNGAGAQALCLQSIQNYNDLIRPVRDSFEIKRLRSDLEAGLYEQLGRAFLLMGKPQDARLAFEIADPALPGGLNAYYFAHTELLEGHYSTALAGYKGEEGIYNEAVYGKVMSDLEQLGRVLPERADSIEVFGQQLSSAIRANNPDLDSLEMAYQHHLLAFPRAYAVDNWRLALSHCERLLAVSEAKVNMQDAPDLWKNRWLDAHLNMAYCLLFQQPLDSARLSRAIRYSLDADRYVAMQYPQYPNAAILKTNLAHAYWLRNRPNDRRKAIDIYFAFLRGFGSPGEAFEYLLKDYRDLHRNGVVFPGLTDLVEATRPDEIKLTDEEWRMMGIEPFR